VTINPDFQEAWYSLGIASIKNEQYNEAVASFARAADLAPDSVQTHISLSAALLAAGKPDIARVRLLESLKRFPDNPVLAGLLSKANHLAKEKKEPR
jgi:Flp pilus assembly protein TadD